MTLGATMNFKKWNVKTLDKNEAAEIASKYGVPNMLAMLLQIRGINTFEEIESYIQMGELSTNPFDIIDMDKAVAKIKKAVDNFDRIAVYGDYDADGITATVILYTYLESIGADVMYYIPSREGEGYGMNESAVSYLNDYEVKLIITVDNGIASVKETEYAKSLGIDVVITDHHRPGDVIPDAVAVVDPFRADCTSTYKDFCGAGIALMLVMAMEWEDGDPDSVFMNYADIAAIGTVADMVPLKGENRVIVKHGLNLLEHTEREGVRALKEKANITEVSASSLSFGIVPRINAVGRMGLPERAVRLLITEDEEDAQMSAEDICEENDRRKNVEAEILKSAIQMVDTSEKLKHARVIVVAGEDWHCGVIGIVAARLTQKYLKPVIVISFDKDGNGVGSARSIEGFSLFECLSACSDKLERFGGHHLAAGLSIHINNLESFRKNIEDYSKKHFDIMPTKTLEIDLKLVPTALSIEIPDQITALEPFGQGNISPLFGLFNMKLMEISPVGGGKHLRLKFLRDNVNVSCMRFFCTVQEFEYKEGMMLDLAVSLDINEFKGARNLSIIVKDMKPSSLNLEDEIYAYSLFEKYKREESLRVDEMEYIKPTREEFADIYRTLRSGEVKSLIQLLLDLPPSKINIAKLLIGLEVFKERGLVDYNNTDELKIKLLPTKGKIDLLGSEILKVLEGRIKN